MRWGLEPVLLLSVLKNIYFEQEIECEEIIRDSWAICITVCASFFVIVFPVFTPFCFLHIWNQVLNDWNSYSLCSDHCFKYFINLFC